MATPRNLDPKFKDEEPRKNVPETEKDDNPDNPRDRALKVTEEAERGQIIYRERFTNPETGAQEERVHGPMPVEEWADYEKEHKL